MRKFFRLPFASQLQLVLLGLMLLSFVLIAQTTSMAAYRCGLVLLAGAALLQMVAGNVPPEARVWRTVKLLSVGLLIVAAIFILGIKLVPTLVKLGADPNAQVDSEQNDF